MIDGACQDSPQRIGRGDPMELRKVLGLIAATGIAVLVIIGLIHFELFVSIWAKVLVAVVLIGGVVTIARTLFRF